MGWILLLISHLYITWALEWDFGDYCYRRGTREIPPLPPSDLNAVDQLLQVQILNRHGARTNFNVGPSSACNAYPHRFQCDPQVLDFQPTLSVEFIPTPHGTCCSGCLLPLGYEQLQRGAVQLKKGYMGPEKTQLPEDLSLKRIYAYTTATERTRQSLQAILRVFFPHNTQTINVHSRVAEWGLVEPSFGCEAFDTLYARATERALEVLASSSHTPTIKPFLTHDDWDCLAAKSCDGMEFPVNGITEEDMRALTNWTYQKAALETNAIADFASAGLMGLVLSKLHERDEYSLVFWSGHDTSMMYFLSALGIWDELWVQYASAISIETYKMKDSSDFPFGFRLVKNGKTLRMPGCESDVCDLEILTRRLAKTGLSPTRFYRSCDIDYESELFASFPSSPPLLLWVIAPLTFASLIYILWLWQSNKDYKRIQ